MRLIGKWLYFFWVSSINFYLSSIGSCHWLTLSRPGGTLCSLTKITAYLQNGLQFGVTAFWLFFLCIFHSESSAPPISPHVCCHDNDTTNRLFLKTRISNVFRLFQAERNFLLDKRLGFGHHETLRSLIKANNRTVTMETFEKIILPKYGHRH